MDWFLGVWEGLKGFVGGVAEKLGLVADETNSGAGVRRKSPRSPRLSGGDCWRRRRGRRGGGAPGRCSPGRGGGHRRGSRSGSRDGAGRVRGADACGDRGRSAAGAAGASARRVRDADSTAPAPRPIHVEVHGGPVTIHAAGADAREIAVEVERHYETMLRRAAAAAELAEDDA